MKKGVTSTAIRDLGTLFDVGAVGGLSDGQLLDRFVERHEEAVFEAIERRHGPMVWGVCRRVLRDHHDAQDAYQATFLVLARKAASIAHREKLGNWLYGVAYQTAMKARATRAKRQAREVQVPDVPEPEIREQNRDDLLARLDRQLSRLPEKYRIPIVLCELEGRTHREAAEQLGVPVGTVSGRLSRARAMLARQLSRRGEAISGGSLAVLLAGEASAGMPNALIGSTAQAASLIAARRAMMAGMVSAEIAALTEEVMKMMLLSKIKIVMVVLLVSLALAVGGTGLAHWAQATEADTGGVSQGDQAGSKQPQVHETQAAGRDDAEEPPDYPDYPEEAKAALPGSRQSFFGGGPDEPRYIRQGDLFFVISPVGDRFSIYDAATKKVSTIRLPGSKESPLNVAPILSDRLVSLMLEGPEINRLYVFSLDDWEWHPQDLKEPASGRLDPTMGRTVVAYTQDRSIYAFSSDSKQWSILELPEGLRMGPVVMTQGDDVPSGMPGFGRDQISPVVTPDSIVVEYDGHVHEFSGKTGEWEHFDLRALIDAALESAEDGAE
ncbi:RNA polymerase sigma factor [Tautonia plasticadhaerens]|uniref:RNA polymerase sigma factor n=1 Tax=Tautonia plasticadhaerens TaxID=2527974 RepID=UPI001E571F38|nr:sigma-70 family RNA polymerase sigma factor [Tautonia plasticadhaerens]